jgi:DNA-binding LytR/AlgR family response regulator
MEDHYVRVHRPGGSTLELMPLQDAISRYGRGGLQVHRSWWVAADAVVDAERYGRNWRLRLSNGLVVPVARNRVAAVRRRSLIGPGSYP